MSAEVETVQAHHWIEVADYLGQPVSRAKENLNLYLQLLKQRGYQLVRANDRPAAKPLVSRADLYQAIEAAEISVLERRLEGERVSDQAQVRAVVDAVLRVIDETFTH